MDFEDHGMVADGQRNAGDVSQIWMGVCQRLCLNAHLCVGAARLTVIIRAVTCSPKPLPRTRRCFSEAANRDRGGCVRKE